MARKSFSVLFFIKKGKLLKNGEAPVCMRITVNGCMVDISIKRSCLVNLWNPAKENSKGKDRMSVELNHYLEITRSHIQPIYRELERPARLLLLILLENCFMVWAKITKHYCRYSGSVPPGFVTADLRLSGTMALGTPPK